jgi:hypothetical protein
VNGTLRTPTPTARILRLRLDRNSVRPCRRSSAVEQLIRNQQVLGSIPSAGSSPSTTSGTEPYWREPVGVNTGVTADRHYLAAARQGVRPGHATSPAMARPTTADVVPLRVQIPLVRWHRRFLRRRYRPRSETTLRRPCGAMKRRSVGRGHARTPPHRMPCLAWCDGFAQPTLNQWRGQPRGSPVRGFHHGPEPQGAPEKRPQIRLQSLLLATLAHCPHEPTTTTER